MVFEVVFVFYGSLVDFLVSALDALSEFCYLVGQFVILGFCAFLVLSRCGFCPRFGVVHSSSFWTVYIP